MRQVVLKIIVLWFFLLPVVLTTALPETVAHDPVVHRDVDDSMALPSMLPERARQLLSSIAPLSMTAAGTHNVNVKSAVLCFCLHKAGETIEELRRLQAEWFDKGRLSLTTQNYDAAVVAFTRVLNLNMRDASVYANRGLSYANRGDHQQALEDFTQAIALNHHLAEAYYARALVTVMVDDVSAARRDLQTAAELNYAPAQRLMRLTRVQSTP